MRMMAPLEPILTGLNTTYVLIDEQARVAAHSPGLPAWLAAPGATLVGASIWDLVPELVGYEAALAELHAGGPPVRLDHLNRPAPDGSPGYTALTAIAAPDWPGKTLLLLTDTSSYGALLQAATQSRNELQLVRRELAQANGQLDYLLQHYMPPEVTEALLAGRLRPGLGGAQREISILFADARGYTALSERLAPEALMRVLNSYLTVLIDVVDTSGGTLVQIQGDALMAIYNAPADQPDHAGRAVVAACAMQRAVAEHQAHAARALPALRFGVGVNTGPALVGNSGAPWRMVYTANGDSVNLAARITGAAPAGAVWVSDATAARLDPSIHRVRLPPVVFKGKTQATGLWEVPVHQRLA